MSDTFIKLILTIKNQNEAIIQLKASGHIIDELYLTISHNLDTLLIRAIDKILSRNKINRLLLKSLEIPTKLKDGAVSGMILKTVKAGLEV